MCPHIWKIIALGLCDSGWPECIGIWIQRRRLCSASLNVGPMYCSGASITVIVQET